MMLMKTLLWLLPLACCWGQTAKHLDNLKPKIDAGIVVFGGATLSKHPNEGEGADMTGSVMLIKADTEADVREFLENDAYTKGGAWNPKEAKIWPFRCAVRSAL